MRGKVDQLFVNRQTARVMTSALLKTCFPRKNGETRAVRGWVGLTHVLGWVGMVDIFSVFGALGWIASTIAKVLKFIFG